MNKNPKQNLTTEDFKKIKIIIQSVIKLKMCRDIKKISNKQFWDIVSQKIKFHNLEKFCYLDTNYDTIFFYDSTGINKSYNLERLTINKKGFNDIIPSLTQHNQTPDPEIIMDELVIGKTFNFMVKNGKE